MSGNECETCAYFAYDEEFDEYYCSVDVDEDDYARMLQKGSGECPLWRNGDEYAVVRHQM